MVRDERREDIQSDCAVRQVDTFCLMSQYDLVIRTSSILLTPEDIRVHMLLHSDATWTKIGRTRIYTMT
jgi:hypothetical protein